MRIVSAIVILTVVASHAARADEMELVKSAEPFARTYNGRAVDVLGIVPGMSLEEVKARIAAEYGSDPVETKNTLSMGYRSISMSTQQYTYSLAAQKGDDMIAVFFSPPSIGNVVVGIDRLVRYPDTRTAPAVEAVLKSVDEKYGAESGPDHGRSDTDFRADWMYNQTGQISCPKRGCFQLKGAYQPGDLESLNGFIADGQHLSITARLSASGSDKSRLYEFRITLDDKANKAKGLTEAFQQIQKAAEADGIDYGPRWTTY